MMWVVWFLASLFYAYQYVLRVMPNIMLEDIMRQFDIGAGLFGQFSGVYYLGYSLVHLPVGIMLDRYGPRKVMAGCILLTVVGMTPLLFAENWAYPIAGRFLMGVGSSAAILGVFKVIRMTFSEKLFPRMLSFSVTIGLLGAIYGGGPVSYMREIFGYQTTVEFLALSGVVLAAITYWVVPEVTTTTEGTVISEIGEVFRNSKVICSCLLAGLMIGPLEGFADVWGSAFLKQVYGFEATVAASFPSMIYIGMCCGAPILSFVADKVGSYLLAIVGAGVAMAVSFLCMVMWQLPPSLLSSSFFILGVCSAYQVLAIYKTSTYARPEVAGLTTAVANMIIMIFGYGFHAVMGSVINAMGGAGSPQALIYGVIVIPIALVAGTTGFFILWIREYSGERSLTDRRVAI